MTKAGTPVKATSTSVRIIDGLVEVDGATVTELADHLDLSKSSIHNHLETLEQLGYIVQDGWEYHVSLQHLEIGAFARQRYRIYRPGIDEARRLASATGFATHVIVLERDSGICIGTAAMNDTGTFLVEAGDQIPLHCTAAGKAMLATLDRESVRELLDEPLPASTENTLTNYDDLFEHFNNVRNRGLAFDREEWQDGIRGIAAAITDSENQLLGAILVLDTAENMSGKTFQQDVPGLVLSSANKIRKEIRQQ